MSSSTSIDVNFLSVTGNQQFIGPSDLSDVDGSKYASVLKLTDGIHDQTLHDLRVNNGVETSVDMDIATNMSVNGDFGLGPQLGNNVLRAKGGYSHIKFGGTLHSRGQRGGVDIELGDWMDQSYAVNKTCDLTGILPHADGKGPNIVAIGWVMPFTTKLGANCKQSYWQSFLLKAYWPTKWLIRTILRIPKGTKGPSWF